MKYSKQKPELARSASLALPREWLVVSLLQSQQSLKKREWMDLERLPSFSVLLARAVVILTIFWGDVIYASFMAFFFWCPVIYWLAVCSSRAVKWWRPPSSSPDETLTLGCCTQVMNGGETVSSRDAMVQNIYESQPKEKPELCETSLFVTSGNP